MTGQPLYGRFIKEWLEKPYNKKRFEKYVDEVIDMTVGKSTRMATWLRLEKGVTDGVVRQGVYLNFFKARAVEVLGERSSTVIGLVE